MRGAPGRLRCEYLDDPLGIGTTRPRLSWWLNDSRPAELQTAYRIQAASSAAALQSDAADLWDTGYVPSHQTANVEYRGRALAAGARVWWRVRCCDSDGIPSPWSGMGRFELGLLSPEDWQARWIAAPLAGSPATAVPAPVIYRDFDLPRAPEAARLHLAILGSAIAEINGRPVSPAEPVEPWSDLCFRVPCRAWDVTRHLHGGRNRIALLLGDGAYCGHVGGGPRQRYGDRPALCGQLVLELDGGERRVVGTDAAWRWYPSWVLRADRDDGEEVDGRQFRADWSHPEGGVAGYPVIVEDPAVERFAQPAPAASVTAVLRPQSAPQRVRSADGRTRLRFDFGRSLLGRARLELRSPRGAAVVLRYGDAAPAPRGELPGQDACATRWASAVDRYTARGDDVEVFEPRFALHAFRYLEVTLDREPHDLGEITAMEVASPAASAAALRCDHRLLEALFRTADRTLHMGLALGPVSALPAADRFASTADCEAIVAGAVACRDTAAALHTWLTGLAAVQDADGRLPRRLPDTGADSAEPGEAEALLPCLWLVYRCYGDRRLLELLFPSVQRYLAGLRERSPALIGGGGDGARPLRAQMLGTAWYCYALSVATRMAGVLGRLEDLERYEALTAGVRVAFRTRFLTRAGFLVDDDQLGYLLALALGILEGAERSSALERLEDQLRRRGFHLDVDLRHGGLLLEVLTLEGRVDLAYQVLLQTTAPGWLHPLTGDASVLWDEARDLPGRLAGCCVAGWLQRFLLGLEVDGDLTPEHNAYRRMRIQPRPPVGPAFAAGAPVTEASGHLDTVHGRYECGWRITADAFELRIRVPGNCGARVILPDGSERMVVAGAHQFSLPHQHLGAGTPAADGIPVLRELSATGGH
jgi:alpha-L-rhamnosidase